MPGTEPFFYVFPAQNVGKEFFLFFLFFICIIYYLVIYLLCYSVVWGCIAKQSLRLFFFECFFVFVRWIRIRVFGCDVEGTLLFFSISG